MTQAPVKVSPYAWRPSLAIDLETPLIGPEAVFPRPICATYAMRNGPGEPQSAILGNGDPEFWDALEGAIDSALNQGTELVFHNGPGFDLPVISFHGYHRPGLASKIWKLFEKGLVRDTSVREKLLNLALHGYVDTYWLPDGLTKVNVNYKLETLVHRYLGIDRHAGKGDDVKIKKGNVAAGVYEGDEKRKQDVWRYHFETLDGMKAAQYPPEASNYALCDTVDTIKVFDAQNARARDEFELKGAIFPDGTPFDVFKTEWLHNAAKYALSHMTAVGFGVDRAEVLKMEEAVKKALRPEQINLLFEQCVVFPAEPSRQATRKVKGEPKVYMTKAVPERKMSILIPGEPGRPVTRLDRKTGLRVQSVDKQGRPKFTKPKKQKKSTKALLALVLAIHAANCLCDEKDCKKFGQQCDEHGLPPLERTAPSKKFPQTEANPQGGQVSCDADAVEKLAPYSSILAQYSHWQGLQKLETQEIPLLKNTSVIYATFEEFKKSGRTSSRGSKSFPSRNIQQLPRGFEVEEKDSTGKALLDSKGKPIISRIEPRHCYVARTPGWVLVSADFSFLELVSLASTVKRLVGYSKLQEVILKGYDPHAWLGAQLAFGSDQSFASACMSVGANDTDARYILFESYKHGMDVEKVIYKKFRGLAKPVGLSLGGGVGARRMAEMALSTYGIVMSLEEAKQYKNLWLDVFPEMREYLTRYIRNNLRDSIHTKEGEREKFCYWSPFGVYRSNCTFTEAANGLALQTPSGEGAKIACFNVTRACWDPAMNSCLLGTQPQAFVHDEMIVGVPNDRYLHERAFEIEKIMVHAMTLVFPDTPVKAEPAAMERWDKRVESVYDVNDRLQVWRPDVKYKMERGKLRVPA